MGRIAFKISLDRCRKEGLYGSESTFTDLEQSIQGRYPKARLTELRDTGNIDAYRAQVHRDKNYEKTSIAMEFDVPDAIAKKYELADPSNRAGRLQFQNDYIFNNVSKQNDAEEKMSDDKKPDAGEGRDLNTLYRELRDKGQIEFITFHPSYSYEEFIEGITVETGCENESCDQLKYTLKPGLFKTMCKKALASAIGLTPEQAQLKSWKNVYEEYLAKKDDTDFKKAPRHVLIIDEINRGDIAKIFGELITLLEADKRISAKNELIVKLPASGDLFGVPPNLYIVATMNTADRSIALLDIALRRRFGFKEMNPDFGVVKAEHIEKNAEVLKKEGAYDLLNKSVAAIEKINSEICKDPSIGRDRQIGHTFLFKVFSVPDLVLVWKHEILPLLEEYCYSDYKKINEILFNKAADTKWIDESKGIKNIEDIGEMLDAILK